MGNNGKQLIELSCSKDPAKMVLICIDGLSWNLLHKFCEKGVLPNLDKIIKKGVSGDLMSIYPLISPRIWATIFTGKDPAKHGVEDFYINSKSIRSKQIWEILQESGYRVGVFKPLTAFTPSQDYSFFVPGLLSTENDVYPVNLEFLNEFSQKLRAQHNVKTSPADLVRYAYKFLRHGCRIGTLWKAFWAYLRILISGDSSMTDRLYKLKEVETVLNSEVFIYCLRKYSPDFAVFYDNCIDFASHFYWKYMEPELFNNIDSKAIKKYGKAIEKFYVLIDDIIGKMISFLGDKAYFMIVSDHGFEACPNYKERGWGGNKVYTQYEFEINVNSLLRLLNLKNKAYGIRSAKGGMFRPKNNETNPEEIEKNFIGIRYKKKGKQVFLVERVNSYVNVKVDFYALDRTQNVILADSSECLLEDFLDFTSERSADHLVKGVIIGGGFGIRGGKILRDSSIYDIFPTILAMYGIPISNDVDGKALTELLMKGIKIKHIDESMPIERESITSQKLLKEEEDHIKKRLKELGYI
jgi:predicted AlkP superfamily phosphohydrolase/phosphomutase